MSALAEFLRNKAAEEAATQESRQETIAEWRAAIERFLEVIRGWIAASDPEGRLAVSTGEQEVDEEKLGKYRVPCLTIIGFGKTVRVTPRSRYTIATHKFDGDKPIRAAGRLTMSNGTSQFALYRFRGVSPAGDDVWMRDDMKTGMFPFTREDFEAALVSYLQ